MASTWHWDEQNDGSFPYTREQTDERTILPQPKPTPSVNWQHSGNRARQNTIARRVRLASSAVPPPPAPAPHLQARAHCSIFHRAISRGRSPSSAFRPGFFIALERASERARLCHQISYQLCFGNAAETDPDSIDNEMMMTMLKNRT